MIVFRERQKYAVLAALECYLQCYDACDGDLPDDLATLATNNGQCKPLTRRAIEDLADHIASVKPLP